MTPGTQLGFLWGGAALACAAAAPWAPAFAQGMPACPFRELLGVPCLTCGSTRALVALARIDLGAAFSWNPLVAGAGILFIAYVQQVFARYCADANCGQCVGNRIAAHHPLGAQRRRAAAIT